MKKEKMEMNENKEKCIEERMPILSQEHKTLAGSEASLKWANWLIDHYRTGDVHVEGNGVTLQKVSEHKIRCIRIFDDPGVWYNLSFVQEQIKCVNIEFEIDPFVIITPIDQVEGKTRENPIKDKDSELDENGRLSMKKEATQSSLDSFGMEVA